MPKKKIGITQLAVTLIVLGIAIVTDRIYETDWVGRILDFWPLLLIWIGIEMVFWHSRTRDKEDGPGWKLDGKSIALLIVVFLATGVFYTVNNVISGNSKSGILGVIQHWVWSNGPGHSVLLKDETLNLGDVQTLTIENAVGRIRVEGTDSNEIHLKAEARIHAADSRAAEEVAKQLPVRLVEGKDARIIVEYPGGFASDRSSVNLTLQVPKKLAVSTKTNAGEIVVLGVASANLQTDMGKIDIQNVSGSIRAHTHAGEIDVESKHPVSADWELQTDMGKIEVSIPRDSSVRVTARTEMGSIDLFDRKSNGPNASLEKSLNDGKYKISASTNAGQIRIESR